jgi:carbon storage regulator
VVREKEMLILTRKIGECLTIGEHVRLVVLGVNGKQVRLGIEAPTDLVVLREEIAPRLPQEESREP